MKKEKAVALKVQENELEHLKSNYAKAGKVRAHKKDLSKSQAETELRIATLDGGEIEELVEQMTSLMDQHRVLQQLKTLMDSCILERDLTVKNIETIQENLELYQGALNTSNECTESDEQLKKLLKDYLASMDQQKGEQECLNEKRTEMETELALIESDLSRQLTLRGQYQAEVQVRVSLDC